MRIALYNENSPERMIMSEHLKQCGREELRKVSIVHFDNHVDLCQAVEAKRDEFDLLIIAQDGTFSLEVMDMLHPHQLGKRLVWFSDLDFAVRSYNYGTLWFGKKPVDLPILRKVFERALKYY